MSASPVSGTCPEGGHDLGSGTGRLLAALGATCLGLAAATVQGRHADGFESVPP
jgi:hypothetical protein